MFCFISFYTTRINANSSQTLKNTFPTFPNFKNIELLKFLISKSGITTIFVYIPTAQNGCRLLPLRNAELSNYPLTSND